MALIGSVQKALSTGSLQCINTDSVFVASINIGDADNAFLYIEESHDVLLPETTSCFVCIELLGMSGLDWHIFRLSEELGKMKAGSCTNRGSVLLVSTSRQSSPCVPSFGLQTFLHCCLVFIQLAWVLV